MKNSDEIDSFERNKKKFNVLRDEKGRFKTITSKIKSQKEFKQYVQSGAYQFGVEAYKNKIDNVTIGKQFDSIRTSKFSKTIKSQFWRVLAEYKGTFATSSPLKTKSQEAFRDAKDQALTTLAWRLYNKKKNFNQSDFDDYDDNESEILKFKESLLDKNIKYTVVYTNYKGD